MQKENIGTFLNCGTIISTPQNKIVIGWGEREWRSQPSSTCEYSFYFPDFYLEMDQPWFSHQFSAILDIDTLIALLDSSKSQGIQMEWVTADFEQFRCAFEDLQRRFQTKELKKAVPFVFEESVGCLSQHSIQEMLKNVLAYVKTHQAYIYGYWTSSEGILGATPEILFHQEIDQQTDRAVIHTVACAGTCSNQTTEDLIGEKIENEHQIVIQGIQQALEPFGRILIRKPKILRLSLLSHVVTPIDFYPEVSITFEQLVKLLHPTPALGAYPKEQGNRWLKEYYRNVDRKRFGAPVGYFKRQDQEFICLVGIRNVQWCEKSIRIGVGCGVIQQSDLWQEWDELRLKIAATKEILGV